MSLAQRWARKRNGNKRRLKGLAANLWQMLAMHRSIFVGSELHVLDNVLIQIQEVLKDWKVNNKFSKHHYLKKEEK